LVGSGGFWKKVRIFIDLGERICGESINLVIFLPLFGHFCWVIIGVLIGLGNEREIQSNGSTTKLNVIAMEVEG